MEEKTIITDLAQFYRKGHDLIVVELIPNAEITLEKVIYTYQKADEHAGNRMFCVLLNTCNHNTWEIPAEVLNYMAKTPFSRKHK